MLIIVLCECENKSPSERRKNMQRLDTKNLKSTKHKYVGRMHQSQKLLIKFVKVAKTTECRRW